MQTNPRLTIVTALLDFDQSTLDTFYSIKKDLSENRINWVIKSKNHLSENQIRNFHGYEKNIKIIAENDSCLYEGLNRAADFINTEYFLVLGSGDKIIPDSLKIAENIISLNPQADCFIFSVNYESMIYDPVPNEIHYRMPSSHQGAILKTKNFLALGRFDISYKYASDYDLLCRYFMKYPKVKSSNFILTSNSPGGLSDRNRFETVLELYVIAHKHWKHKYKDFEFNDLTLRNLNATNDRLKIKKQKKEKGEEMQTNQELKTELFSHISKIEIERQEREKSLANALFSRIEMVIKALNEANKDFVDLHSELQEVKKSLKNEKAEKPNLICQHKNSANIEKQENQEEQLTPLDLISSNEKIKLLFGGE